MIRELIEKKNIQKMQDGFAHLANVSIYCIDGEGNEITRVSGDKRESEKLLALVGRQRLQELYDRICKSPMEDQLVEDTEYTNIKIAAVAIKLEGKPILCWLACCVLEEDDNRPGDNWVTGFYKKTTEDKFYCVLDLMRMWMTELSQAGYLKQEAEAESRRSRFSESEMSQVLKRTEVMTHIVQLLVGNEPFEILAEKVIEATQDFLHVGSVQLLRLSRDGQRVDAIAQQQAEDVVPLFPMRKEVHCPGVLGGDKLLVVSFRAEVSETVQDYMKISGITAFMTIPIQLRGEVAMYLFVCENRKERVWQVEEIKFVNDVAKILESMLERRIARNSMASSYKTLTEILNVVGNCVCVRDAHTKQLLFANKLFQQNFDQEMKQGTLDRILDKSKPVAHRTNFYELYHLRGKRWYDMHYTYIDWVDGRKAVIFALYDITDKKIYQENIEKQAETDFLTGLHNRMCCERDLAVHIEHAKELGKKGALLYLDLDDFKHINDGLGHQYGDVLLKAISKSLQCVEGIQDTCYRVGGDEFVIIVSPEKYARIQAIVDKIKDVFSKPWFLKDGDYYCTMSMGVCTFPDNGEDVLELIKKADIVMYEAKKLGKNRVVEYSQDIHSSSGKRLDMEKQMRDATAGNYEEFQVYFQPIMDIQKANAPCVGAEALVRWISPTLGFVSPGEFIPLAEYLGLINPIGNYIMKEACKACKYWNDHGHPEYKVNVNLSVVQLVQTDIVEVVKETLEETKVNPKNLTLEVTEGLAINDMKRMKEILNKIRALGVRIALDDFGTGYSSLNHIREIPLDVIKVDQSFVTDLAEDSYTQAFIKMVAELADAIGVSICVEGIETLEQYKVLEGMQVRLVQGYYFDKPMPRADFENKYL